MARLMLGQPSDDAPAVVGPHRLGPQPVEKGSLSLEEVLSRRRSVRRFTSDPLSQGDLGQLLWAAQGTTSPDGLRTTPSAGATFPLEIYVASPEGVLLYAPARHAVKQMSISDVRPALARASGGQSVVGGAVAILVVAAVRARTEARYGTRASRYVALEAGHAAQNVLLMATRLGLGATPVGAFVDGDVRAAAGLPADHDPLCLIALGHPR